MTEVKEEPRQFTINLGHKKFTCLFEDGPEYGNGYPALSMVGNDEEEDYWEPFAVLSVNRPDLMDQLEDGQYFIKDHDENETIVAQLQDMGVLRFVTFIEGNVVMTYHPENIPSKN